jgi:hypothetical protein
LPLEDQRNAIVNKEDLFFRSDERTIQLPRMTT